MIKRKGARQTTGLYHPWRKILDKNVRMENCINEDGILTGKQKRIVHLVLECGHEVDDRDHKALIKKRHVCHQCPGRVGALE